MVDLPASGEGNTPGIQAMKTAMKASIVQPKTGQSRECWKCAGQAPDCFSPARDIVDDGRSLIQC